MKNLAFAALGVASVAVATPAMAQSFTYDVTWEPVESVGSITGPNGEMNAGGGTVNGTYETTFDDGTVVNGAVRCVGMRQPHGSIFAIHLSCTAKDDQGTYSLIYGCNFLGEPGPETPLGCAGGIQAKDGENAGARGGLTMYWYSDEKSSGTGQWYTAG